MAETALPIWALTAAVVFVGFQVQRDAAPQRYQISASADGMAAWRIDTRTGDVTLCGANKPGQHVVLLRDEMNRLLAQAAAKPGGFDTDTVGLASRATRMISETTACTPWPDVTTKR